MYDNDQPLVTGGGLFPVNPETLFLKCVTNKHPNSYIYLKGFKFQVYLTYTHSMTYMAL